MGVGRGVFGSAAALLFLGSVLQSTLLEVHFSNLFCIGLLNVLLKGQNLSKATDIFRGRALLNNGFEQVN
jgi:hypothetical protein